jgi:hypothetical protein
LFNDRLEDIQIGLAKDRKVLGFINQRVMDLQYMADYYPEDRRVSVNLPFLPFVHHQSADINQVILSQ